MMSSQQDIMQHLMDKNNFGTINETELNQLTQLVESGQRLMSRKAEAMKLLMDRGYTIIVDALKPLNE